ncbi:hypothetical protein [Bacillus pumilus]|uniref:hypothetical protein n=1 Tax=Bacillus pumilus TaxID=1408 RepID=UPI0031F54F7A
MVRSQRVNAIRETLHCEECDEAPELVFSNMMLTSNPPQYPFKCPLCMKEVYMETSYPRTRYESVD